MTSTLSKPQKIAVLAVVVFLQLLGTLAEEGRIQRTKVLDPKYHVSWDIDEGRSKVIFNITAQTTGYVGFGLSSNGAMAKADIAIGGFKNGKGYLNDYHGPSSGNGKPYLDEHNDYHLLDAWENATHTYLAFSRVLKTCDSEDVPITETGLKIIWRLGKSDDLRIHATRGASAVYFLDPEQPLPDLSKFMKHDVTTTVVVPNETTTYLCSIHRLPNLTGENYMVAYEPYFGSPEAKKFTHHMLMYACPYQHDYQTKSIDPPTADQSDSTQNGSSEDDQTSYSYWATKSGESVDCFGGSHQHNRLPTSFGPCQRIEYGWALGGEIAVNPPQVGFPFISGQYYRLEVHLDNPEVLNGVEITMNGALISIQAVYDEHLMIPPNSTGFTIASHCTAECTNHTDIPPKGLTVYSALLHAHKSGRAIRVRHFREGKELPSLINDDNYDFNYQSHRQLERNVTIFPGDQLIAECTYDTNWKGGQPVLGGPGTADEMCMAILSYYPAINESFRCQDWLLSQSHVSDFLGINYPRNVCIKGMQDIIDPMVEIANGTQMRFSKAVEGFHRARDKRREYQKLQRYGRHDVRCFDKIVHGSYPENVTEYADLNKVACSEMSRSARLKEGLVGSFSGSQLFSRFEVLFTTVAVGLF